MSSLYAAGGETPGGCLTLASRPNKCHTACQQTLWVAECAAPYAGHAMKCVPSQARGLCQLRVCTQHAVVTTWLQGPRGVQPGGVRHHRRMPADRPTEAADGQ